MPSVERYLTPPQLAKLWGIKSDKIVCWIRRGEISAIDVSNNPGCGRPRYRISPEAVAAFEAARSGATPKPALKPKRRKKLPADFVRYFT